MKLNPFYHLRKYRQQAEEIEQQRVFNNHLLNRNAEILNDLAKERQALDQANAKIAKLQEELDEIQSEFLILASAKTMTRKEARALKNHKTQQQPQPVVPYMETKWLIP